MPDFAALRKQMEGRRGSDYLEGQVALNAATREMVIGLTMPELSRAFTALTPERVEEIAQTWLAESRRSSLVLIGD